MKKFIPFLFMMILLSSCVCTIAQVPPQTVYAGANCEALLPDYTTKVTALDNCLGAVVIKQTPVAGTVLTATNPAITVSVTATDAFGNVSKPMNISVTMLDTIPPILSWPLGQVNMTDDDVSNLYKNWEAAVKVNGIARWMYDRTWTQGLPLADTTFVDSCGVTHDYHVEDNLKYFHNIIKLSDEEFDQYVTLVETNK